MSGREMDKILEQAKEMHREQVVDAALKLELSTGNFPPKLVKENAEKYHEETYRGQNQGQNVLEDIYLCSD